MAFSTSNDNDEVLSEINITPLVDVMLVLLVAFIVTAPLLNNSIHVNLPKTVTLSPPEQKKPVTISVSSEGKIYVDKEEIQVKDLGNLLSKKHQNEPDLVYHLSSDESVKYGAVAKVMASIEKAGITKLAVITQSE